MLGPNKWRFLTIVAGLLLANAIDSPVRLRQYNNLSTYPTSLKYVGSNTPYRPPWPTRNVRISRNLFPPYQQFSNSDEVKFVEAQHRRDGSQYNQFGSFRISRKVQRRSDNDFLQTSYKNTNSTSITTKPNYVYIPIGNFQPMVNIPVKKNVTLSSIRPPQVQIEEISGEDVLQDRNGNEEDDLSGRRIGFKFPNYNHNIPFHPQGYREDSPVFGEGPQFERPYSEDLFEDQQPRFSKQLTTFEEGSQNHQIDYPGPSSNTKPVLPTTLGKLFRDDVTKFGDINGPVTAFPRQNRGIYFGQEGNDFSRNPRPFFPQPTQSEFVGPGSRKSRFFPFKSSRTPRVVFPTNDNIGTGLGGNGGFYNDAISFR